METRIEAVFGTQDIEIKNYNAQLKEVVVGSQSFFATHDGRYVFLGPVLDTARKVDIAQEKANQHRQRYLASVPKEQFVRYPSANNSKHEITVFTDIDCPYCRKLHNHINEFNRLGITVNYAMLPRSGLGSRSYDKTLAALCSNKPAESITRAMQSQKIDAKRCESVTLTQQIALARALRISSTPTIVLPNGELKLGYTSPKKLLALLDEQTIN